VGCRRNGGNEVEGVGEWLGGWGVGKLMGREGEGRVVEGGRERRVVRSGRGGCGVAGGGAELRRVGVEDQERSRWVGGGGEGRSGG